MNFAFSLARTETTGEPRGTRVSDRILADAAVSAGLRKFLPKRVGRGEVANSLEALVGYAWLERLLTIDQVLSCLKTPNSTPTQCFARLATLALSILEK